MPNTTSTYEPLVLVDTADLPEEEWLEYTAIFPPD